MAASDIAFLETTSASPRTSTPGPLKAAARVSPHGVPVRVEIDAEPPFPTTVTLVIVVASEVPMCAGQLAGRATTPVFVEPGAFESATSMKNPAIEPFLTVICPRPESTIPAARRRLPVIVVSTECRW